jgi:hypothetical protein
MNLDEFAVAVIRADKFSAVLLTRRGLWASIAAKA